MTKRSRRSQKDYPALEPQYNLKTRIDMIDYDYIDKLSDKEKDWLNRFTEEFTNANLNHKGKKLHKSKKQKKDCYDRNNARNRCILTKAKASGRAVSLEDINNKVVDTVEDKVIDKLDDDGDSK